DDPEPRIRWGKLREEYCCMKYRDEAERALVSGEERLDGWAITAEDLRKADKK
ncbi:hypothetical protein SK128_019034, partial [Halocaridina rubra]